MFRKEFLDVISSTGLIPIVDIKQHISNKDPDTITELELLKLGFFDDVKFAQTVADKNKLIYIDVSKAKINEAVVSLIKKTDIHKFRVIPINKSAKNIGLAIFDPTVREFANELQTYFQYPVEFILTNLKSWKELYDKVEVTMSELLNTIQEVKGGSEDFEKDQIKESDIGAEVVNTVNKLLVQALIKGASDIHFEPYEKFCRVRYRVDGALVEVEKPSRSSYLPLVSRVKIMAQLDIAEKRKPQDGRIKLIVGGKPIDFRVSSCPTLFGEKVVLRLLDSSNLQVDMTKLGMEAKQLSAFKECIHRPFGMCLVTGPTGSGKTTTLYSALAELNQVTDNISTAEDPVEFNLAGINQVNVRKEIGLTFAAALKSFLRQDPDIIMVGEIRDVEVGEIAIEAALTGHMVLSTLHTNDAASTITRLINMGIESFLVVGALNCVIAQRLCRRICDNCKETDNSCTIEQIVACGLTRESAMKIVPKRGKGCRVCNETGYKGRVAIYELLVNSPSIKDLILQGASNDEIKKQAVKEGMKTLRMCGLTKFASGVTTLEEVVSNSSSDKFK